MIATIITIGDEILIGQVTDTNSGWMAQRLNEIGVSVKSMLSISDNKKQIIDCLNNNIPESDFIFITGGLGPTNDDITKKVLAEYFNTELILDPEILNNIKTRLSKIGVDINKNNHDQALVPRNAKILKNEQGTAPGMMFEKNGKYIFSMPGVPYEMEHIFEKHIISFIKENFIKSEIVHKTLLVVGIAESILAEKIAEWENSLPESIKLAYLPSYGYIRLRLSCYSANKEIINIINNKINELKNIIAEYLIAEEDTNLERLVAKLLKEKNKTLSTAESCTGGKIASLLTSISGSSEYFIGSVISYSNSVKINILNVIEEDIEKYGAVSQQVVEQMAVNVRELLNTDFSIATSGIAGPSGGSEEKPVGTIWIAIASKDGVVSKKHLFVSDRERNIMRTSNTALNMLIKQLQ